ncbi:unnamed protein product, partial [Allacma fusca]
MADTDFFRFRFFWKSSACSASTAG